jgi:hypothetical protein
LFPLGHCRIFFSGQRATLLRCPPLEMLNEILAIDTLLFSRACPLDFVLTRALLDFPLTPPSSTLDDLALTFQAAPDTAPPLSLLYFSRTLFDEILKRETLLNQLSRESLDVGWLLTNWTGARSCWSLLGPICKASPPHLTTGRPFFFSFLSSFHQPKYPSILGRHTREYSRRSNDKKVDCHLYWHVEYSSGRPKL